MLKMLTLESSADAWYKCVAINVSFCFQCGSVFNAFLLYFSHFLYPSNKLQVGDGNGDENTSSSGDGKYELLSVANNLIVEEIRSVMLKSKSKLLLN